MPELPEVQTIISGLQKIVGKTIDNLEVREPKRFYSGSKNPSQTGSGLSADKANKLAGKLKGQKIHSILRKGKIIIISLDDLIILIHLKLTGQLIYQAKDGKRIAGGHPDQGLVDSLPSKATNFIFAFKGETKLFFNDLRKFGYLQVIPKNKIESIPTIAALGIDPLSEKFNGDFLMQKLDKKPNSTIKQFLMDQTIIAGVGNIYSDEGLFFAGVLPYRKNSTIKKDEAKRIVDGIKKALELGLKYQGTSDSNYVKADGMPGKMQEHLRVYQREGEGCRKCKSKIKRVKISGRSSHYCPKCQK